MSDRRAQFYARLAKLLVSSDRGRPVAKKHSHPPPPRTTLPHLQQTATGRKGGEYLSRVIVPAGCDNNIKRIKSRCCCRGRCTLQAQRKATRYPPPRRFPSQTKMSLLCVFSAPFREIWSEILCRAGCLLGGFRKTKPMLSARRKKRKISHPACRRRRIQQDIIPPVVGNKRRRKVTILLLYTNRKTSTNLVDTARRWNCTTYIGKLQCDKYKLGPVIPSPVFHYSPLRVRQPKQIPEGRTAGEAVGAMSSGRPPRGEKIGIINTTIVCLRSDFHSLFFLC